MQLMQKMRKQNHLPHACLIYGEQGSGRKTLAKYFAMTALCTGDQPPCGSCRNCQKILNGIHPDLIFPEHSGKKQSFSVDTIRAVCRDAIIAPNDSDKKIYLFTDCDHIGIPAQNTLLKLTEEPPEHVILLFTAQDKHVFLSTMLSRMMQFSVCPCSPAETKAALLEHGISSQEAERAIQVYGRNIGLALAWLENPDMQNMTHQAAELTAAIAHGRQYEILKILSNYEHDRARASAFLKLLELQCRDALAVKYTDAVPVGCDRNSAEQLSQVLTLHRTEQMCQAIQTAYEALEASVSTKLALAALGGSLMI